MNDLELKARCLAGDHEALDLLRRRVAEWSAAVLQGLRQGNVFADEVEARVLEVLLLEPSPALERYDGRGDMRAWVWVIALRVALNLKRARKREEPLSDSVLLDAASGDDPERTAFRSLYAVEVKQAFSVALHALPVRERNMLRQHVLDGLNFEVLGRLYGLHPTSVSRALSQVHERLEQATYERVAWRLRLSQSEARSIVTQMLSAVEHSVGRLLQETE